MDSRRLLSWYGSTLGHAVLSAAALWAALPPLDLWPLAWIAPVWWLLLIRREALPGRRPYVVLSLVGFLFWMAALHWLRLPHPATSIGWIALSGYLALHLPVFVGLTRIAVHRFRVSVVVAAPIVWTGLELARAHLLTGFTMASLGHTQYHWIGLIQMSDITGAYGVSFVVMAVAACLARMLPCESRRPAVWPLLPAAATLAAVLAYGYSQITTATQEPTPTARIALIQGSIDIEMKYDPKQRGYLLDQYVGLSRRAASENAPLDLIVWPETMFPQVLYVEGPNTRMPEEWKSQQPRFRSYSQEDFQRELREVTARSRWPMENLAKQLDTPLLLGVSTVVLGDGDEQIFNSAAMVARDGTIVGRYDKMHRVLFGEYVPWSDEFPWLRRFTPVPSLIAAGEHAVSFPVAGLRIAPNICYETVLPHVIRRQVRELTERGEEPDVLVNLTNDGWFWGSSELDMHLVCGVFRAVECRKPLLIAANTGFSAWIDANGVIRQQGRRRDTDVLVASVAASHRSSGYLAYGDWFAGVCLTACVVLAASGLASRRQKPVKR